MTLPQPDDDPAPPGTAPAAGGGDAARRRPGDWPRRVLFTVCGLSPQVVTETLYALAVAAAPGERFVPTEVHVLTTSEGAQRVRLALLSEHPGGFHRLRRDYALPPITFGEAQIHLVTGDDGQPLADIRCEADNARMADAVTELLRGFTADSQCALHVSIAGGRKTMGFYAGYALSLFGREQDRLSHVLVSAPFESSWEFFYPTPYPQVIATAGGRELADAAQAEVRLAQIPFVRLRPGLPEPLLQGRSSFAATVAAANAGLREPLLLLDAATHRIVADGVPIALPPAQFSLFAALAARACRGRPPLRAPARDVHDAEWAEEVLADLRSRVGAMQVPVSFEDSLRQDCSGSRISPQLSRLRRHLADALAPGRPALYFNDGGRQRHKRYRVPLPPQAIRFCALDATASLPIDADGRPAGTLPASCDVPDAPQAPDPPDAR